MTMDTEEFALRHLDDFKAKMRITHDGEDSHLLRMLQSSVRVIAMLVGAATYDDSLVELTFERAMCDYNDALDEFQTLYGDEIENLYFANLVMAHEEVGNVEREKLQA